MSSMSLFDPTIHVEGQSWDKLTPTNRDAEYAEADIHWIKKEVSRRDMVFVGFEETVVLFKGPVSDPKQDYCKVKFARCKENQTGTPFTYKEVAICACPEGIDYNSIIPSIWGTRHAEDSHYYSKYKQRDSVRRVTVLTRLRNEFQPNETGRFSKISHGTADEICRLIDENLPENLPASYLRDLLRYLDAASKEDVQVLIENYSM